MSISFLSSLAGAALQSCNPRPRSYPRLLCPTPTLSSLRPRPSLRATKAQNFPHLPRYRAGLRPVAWLTTPSTEPGDQLSIRSWVSSSSSVKAPKLRLQRASAYGHSDNTCQRSRSLRSMAGLLRATLCFSTWNRLTAMDWITIGSNFLRKIERASASICKAWSSIFVSYGKN